MATTPHFGARNAPFIPNGSMGPSPVAGVSAGLAGLSPQSRIIEKNGARILCVADVRGNLTSLNDLAKQANADHIIHTGDFGFYDSSSLERIADKTLRHVAQYSPLLNETQKKAIQGGTGTGATVKERLSSIPGLEPVRLSELPDFINKKYTLNVPVYTVWGACEDVRVLEKLRSGEYKVDNLHIIDEANSRLLDVGGVKLRLLGLGGAVVMHKLFDNGEGKTTIAGGQGTMWTTLLQMGELIDTANRVYDPTETRVFITHASASREGLLNQLSVTLKSDFSISAGLHFRYGSSYNEFSVNPSLDHYRGKLAASKASFNDVWETVKGEVQPAVAQNPAQQRLLENALQFVDRMPQSAQGAGPFGGPTAGATAGVVDESAFKNMWNFNLADAAFGWLVLEVENGRIGMEMKAQGFNFAHRSAKPQTATSQTNVSSAPSGPSNPTPTGPSNVNVPSGPSNGKPTYPPAVPQSFSAPTASRQAAGQAQHGASTPAETSKPGTPRPGLAPGRSATPSAPADIKVENGANIVKPPSPATPLDTRSSAFRDKEPGLYVSGVPNEQAARDLFSADTKAKISSVMERQAFKTKLTYYYVFFKSKEDAKAALDELPTEVKTQSADKSKTWVKEIDYEQVRQNQENASTAKWGSSRNDSYSRGGAASGLGNDRFRNSSASESEGLGGGSYRGRGALRGGRKPSGQYEPTRGSTRGGRGRGRGGYKDGEGSGPSTPAAE